MEFHEWVDFVNIEGVASITTDTRSGSNNLMIEVQTSTGVPTVLVMHPAVFNSIKVLVKDNLERELFNMMHGINPIEE